METFEKIKHFEIKNRTKISFIIKISISFLFIISAFAKLFPIEIFEKQLIDISNQKGLLNGFTNWCNVRWWSRGIISIELFLGIMLLFPYYLKRLFLPFSVILLICFIGHLAIQISMIGNIGNCGCMGGWLPMSPLEAILKNLISIMLIIYVYKHTSEKDKAPIYIPLSILMVVIISVILNSKWSEECCCLNQIDSIVQKEKTTLQIQIDSLKSIIIKSSDTIQTTNLKNNSFQKPRINYSASEFHAITEFEKHGKQFISSIDRGNSIVIIANPDCDHCISLATKIAKLNLNLKKATIYILFNNPDETDSDVMSTQAKRFIKSTGINAAYKIIELGQYIRFLGDAPGPPRLVLLSNGKIVYEYLGEGDVNVNKINDLLK